MSATTSQPLPPTGPGGAPQRAKPYPFWLGGASACCAATITHPLDLTKYRLQTATVKQGMVKTMVDTVKGDGIQALWHGVSGTWLRQASYSITRFAVYEKTKESFITPDKPKPTSLELAFAAGLGGGVASVVGCPAEVVLVRMTSDLNRPVAERYAYPDAVRGLVQLVRAEGLSKLTLGMGPNVAKGVFLNVGQMAGYDFSKDVIQRSGLLPDSLVVTAATFCAGTAATTFAQPVDFIKSRVQAAKGNTSAMTLVREAIKKDGPLVMMRGFVPAWIRLQPQSTLLFFFFEYFKGIIDKQRAAEAEKLGRKL